jgi:hypothetical protein
MINIVVTRDTSCGICKHQLSQGGGRVQVVNVNKEKYGSQYAMLDIECLVG